MNGAIRTKFNSADGSPQEKFQPRYEWVNDRRCKVSMHTTDHDEA